MSGEQYAESAVLVAIMDGDYAEARSRLTDFFPGELVTFHQQAQKLVEMIAAEARAQAVAS